MSLSEEINGLLAEEGQVVESLHAAATSVAEKIKTVASEVDLSSEIATIEKFTGVLKQFVGREAAVVAGDAAELVDVLKGEIARLTSEKDAVVSELTSSLDAKVAELEAAHAQVAEKSQTLEQLQAHVAELEAAHAEAQAPTGEPAAPATDEEAKPTGFLGTDPVPEQKDPTITPEPEASTEAEPTTEANEAAPSEEGAKPEGSTAE